jgi:hypothetical protein
MKLKTNSLGFLILIVFFLFFNNKEIFLYLADILIINLHSNVKYLFAVCVHSKYIAGFIKLK